MYKSSRMHARIKDSQTEKQTEKQNEADMWPRAFPLQSPSKK